jgi:hypothetical protein
LKWKLEQKTPSGVVLERGHELADFGDAHLSHDQAVEWEVGVRQQATRDRSRAHQVAIKKVKQ